MMSWRCRVVFDVAWLFDCGYILALWLYLSDEIVLESVAFSRMTQLRWRIPLYFLLTYSCVFYPKTISYRFQRHETNNVTSPCIPFNNSTYFFNCMYEYPVYVCVKLITWIFFLCRYMCVSYVFLTVCVPYNHKCVCCISVSLTDWKCMRLSCECTDRPSFSHHCFSPQNSWSLPRTFGSRTLTSQSLSSASL